MATTPPQEVPAALSLLSKIAAQQPELITATDPPPPPQGKLTASEELRTQICKNRFCQCTRRDKTLSSIPDLIRARVLRHLQKEEAQRRHQNQHPYDVQREARKLLAALGAAADYSIPQPRIQIIHTPVILPSTTLASRTGTTAAAGGTRQSSGPGATAETVLDDTVQKQYHTHIVKRAHGVETNGQYPSSEPVKKKACTDITTGVAPLPSSHPPPKKRPVVTWASAGDPPTTMALTSTTLAEMEPNPPRRVSETSELSILVSALRGSSPTTQSSTDNEDDVVVRIHTVPVLP